MIKGESTISLLHEEKQQKKGLSIRTFGVLLILATCLFLTKQCFMQTQDSDDMEFTVGDAMKASSPKIPTQIIQGDREIPVGDKYSDRLNMVKEAGKLKDVQWSKTQTIKIKAHTKTQMKDAITQFNSDLERVSGRQGEVVLNGKEVKYAQIAAIIKKYEGHTNMINDERPKDFNYRLGAMASTNVGHHFLMDADHGELFYNGFQVGQFMSIIIIKEVETSGQVFVTQYMGLKYTTKNPSQAKNEDYLYVGMMQVRGPNLLAQATDWYPSFNVQVTFLPYEQPKDEWNAWKKEMKKTLGKKNKYTFKWNQNWAYFIREQMMEIDSLTAETDLAKTESTKSAKTGHQTPK